MGKKTKYPAQKLTSTDKDVLDKVAFLYAAMFYSLKQQYPNPKEYVEKILLKAAQSDKKVAALYTIIFAKNNPSNYLFKPEEINRRLANDLVDIIRQNYNDTLLQDSGSNRDHIRFMHPRDLREKVLKVLEDHGILLHLNGKEEIKKYKR
jgi:hypothetical protein